jgi:hypothetical protein
MIESMQSRASTSNFNVETRRYCPKAPTDSCFGSGGIQAAVMEICDLDISELTTKATKQR